MLTCKGFVLIRKVPFCFIKCYHSLKARAYLEVYMNKIVKILVSFVVVFVLILSFAACQSVQKNMNVEDTDTQIIPELFITEIVSVDRTLNLSPGNNNHSSYTLTVTVTPSYATNKLMDWTVDWVNSSSTFASGKDPEDYLSVETLTDGALSATVTALQAFGEPIRVTVTSRANPMAYAYVIFEYGQRIRFSTLNFVVSDGNGSSTTLTSVGSSSSNLSIPGFDETTCLESGTWDLSFTYDYLAYTTVSSSCNVTYMVKPTAALYTELQNKNIARSSDSAVTLTDSKLSSLYNALVDSSSKICYEGDFYGDMIGENMNVINAAKTSYYGVRNKFNSAVLSNTSGADIQLNVTIQTDYESKTYVFYLTFDRNSVAFIATAVSITPYPVGTLIL